MLTLIADKQCFLDEAATMPPRSKDSAVQKAPPPARRTLLIALLVALVFGVLGLGDPIDDTLRNIRNRVRAQDASGQIVLVSIDDKSLEALGGWPWSRKRHAEIIQRLRTLGAAHVFYNIGLAAPTRPADDNRLVAELTAMEGRVTLTNRYVPTSDGKLGEVLQPAPMFRRHASEANTNLWYNGSRAVLEIQYSMDVAGKRTPSLASAIAQRTGPADTTFPVDYSTRIGSIPTISAIDLLAGRVDPGQIAGKRILVGITSTQLDETYDAPSFGLTVGAIIHVLGAETLLRGTPLALGWLPFLAIGLCFCALMLWTPNRAVRAGALAAGLLTLLVAPALLESRSIFAQVVPGIAPLLWTAAAQIIARVRDAQRIRAVTNSISGLPNLDALREEVETPGAPLIAVRVQNYAEIVSTLPEGSEKPLLDQITSRLSLGIGGAALYQGDEGTFAWFGSADDDAAHGDALDALHALFRSPVVVGDRQVDLMVAFGVDTGTDRSLSSRLGGALAAADEAMRKGLRWLAYDTSRLKDSAWKLSLLSRLDSAIDAGDVWVAYQPKLDLVTRRIKGAEALVRWSHPEKGEISPGDFVPAAEQQNRIEKLTMHVLEHAIAAAAAINRRGVPFDIAVNLSARLTGSAGLVEDVRRLLDRHRLAAERLTLEVTETAALAVDACSIATLEALRALGVQLSIDDYGTGFSTLDYLRSLPASEIKIDRSFVDRIDTSPSDHVMVNSTIQLAHSLGRRVVAEGVERRETLDALVAMGCDEAQGYLIAKPMKLRDLTSLLFSSRGRFAA